MDDKIKKGTDTITQLWGNPRTDLKEELGILGEMIIEHAFADIYSRPGLSLRDRELITISMLIAQGGAPQQLKNHMLAGVNQGIQIEELLEIVLQSYLYNGFPKAIQAYKVLQEVADSI